MFYTWAGYVSDNDVKNREQALRRALLKDPVVRVKLGAQPEVSQVGLNWSVL